MADYDVDKIEVAISDLFNLEVTAKLRVERGHGLYVLNEGLLIQRPELSESHFEQQWIWYKKEEVESLLVETQNESNEEWDETSH